MVHKAYNLAAAFEQLKLDHSDLSLRQAGELVIDSRVVKQSDIFCAVIGHQLDGRDYISAAIKQGASLMLVDTEQLEQHNLVEFDKSSQVPLIYCYQLNKQLFTLAQAYYQQPQKGLLMIGVTGTNGKTSVSQLIAQLFDACQGNAAVVGTTGAGKLNHLQAVANTTPGAIELHHLLNQFIEQDIQQVALEVSSHALAQQRVKSDFLDVAVFTNLSRDHLDYHHDMSDYAAAKKQIFSHNNRQVAVVNGDDQQAQSWLKSWPNEDVIVYGCSETISSYPFFVQASNIQHKSNGVNFTVKSHFGSGEFFSPLIGHFNIDNLLAAITVLLSQGVTFNDLIVASKNIQPVIGRMEAFNSNQLPTAVVDYAHTPDALKNALEACRQHCQGQLFVVFGCGGDRDRGKRAQMGEIAEQLADQIFLTNDNPRNRASRIDC